MKEFFVTRNETDRLNVDGTAVKEARRAAGLTQTHVEIRMRSLGYYLPQPYVSMVERGKYQWGFTDRMATALAASLGVSVGQITGAQLSLADVQQIKSLLRELGELVEQGNAEVSPRLAAA